MKKESSIEVGSEGVQGILLARAAGLLLTDKIRKVDLIDKCLYSKCIREAFKNYLADFFH